jgi:hypothetical protein
MAGYRRQFASGAVDGFYGGFGEGGFFEVLFDAGFGDGGGFGVGVLI